MTRSTRIAALFLGAASLIGALAITAAPAGATVGDVTSYEDIEGAGVASYGNRLWTVTGDEVTRFNITNHAAMTWNPATISGARLITTASTGAPAHGYSDVPAGAPYGPALNWARAEGVVGAFAGNEFRPGQTVTRLQAATMPWKVAGSPTGNPAHGFSDVAAGNQAVRWASAAHVIAGFPNATFRGSLVVKRSQIARSIYNLAMNPAAWGGTPPSTVLFWARPCRRRGPPHPR